MNQPPIYRPQNFINVHLAAPDTFGFSPLAGSVAIIKNIMLTFYEGAPSEGVIDINGAVIVDQPWGGSEDQSIAIPGLWIPVTAVDTCTFHPLGALYVDCTVSGVLMSSNDSAPI